MAPDASCNEIGFSSLSFGSERLWKFLRSIYTAIGLLLACFVTAPCEAHSPYFEGAGRTFDLPEGRPVEMRIARGDGIILAPDPTRIVLLDSDGRLLARSRRGSALSIVCRESCVGYDHIRLQTLSPDPKTFLTQAPIVTGGSSDDNVWELDTGGEVGFVREAASILDVVHAETAHIRHNAPILATILLTIAAWTTQHQLRTALARPRPTPETRRHRLWLVVDLVWILAFCVSATMFGLSWLSVFVTICCSLAPAAALRLATGR